MVPNRQRATTGIVGPLAWAVATVLSLALPRVGRGQALPSEESPIEERSSSRLVAPDTGSVSHDGAFRYSVPLEVPPFHGIEPKLALVYHSHQGNGLVGTGWDLAGTGYVERATPGGGSAQFDGSDVYYLDGQELVTCAEQTDRDAGGNPVSPSCRMGGTHSTKVETFVRVRFDEKGPLTKTDDVWVVTHKNGTRAIYGDPTNADTASRHLASRNGNLFVFRWYLSSVIDTHGNTVVYDWMQPGLLGHVCYNGVWIQLYYRDRADALSFATGSIVETVTRLLDTVDVCVGTPPWAGPCRADGLPTGASDFSKRLRAYHLSYATNWRWSALQSVQEYGRDATLAPNLTGGMTPGGSALPVTSFSYRSAWWHGWASSSDGHGQGSRAMAGDFDGDGKTDVLQHVTNTTQGSGWRVLRSTGTLFNSAIWYPTCSTCSPMGNEVAGDFTGDGRDDMLQFQAGVGWHVYRSNGTQFVKDPLPWSTDSAGVSRLLDRNGDGRLDFVQYVNGGWYRYLSNEVTTTQGRFSTGSLVNLPGSPTGSEMVGDFNGDGLGDIIHSYNSLWVASVSDPGSGGSTWSIDNANSVENDEEVIGDFNGDGKSDFLQRRLVSGSGFVFRVWLSNGNGFDGPFDWGAIVLHRLRPADIDGDGKTDLFGCWYFGGSPTCTWGAALSTGRGFDSPQSIAGAGAYKDLPAFVGDFDGNGRDDVLQYAGVNGWQFRRASGSRPTLYTITNPLGGMTFVLHRLSSEFENHPGLPVVPVVGQISTYGGPQSAAPVSSTTTFDYLKGYFYKPERRFLGFELVVANLPCIEGETSCPWRVDRYDKYFGRVDTKGSLGYTRLIPVSVTRLRASSLEHVNDGGPRFFAGMDSRETPNWENGSELLRVPFRLVAESVTEILPTDLNITLKRMRTTSWTYDANGNVDYLRRNGEGGADATNTEYVYRENPTDYVINRPMTERVRQGISAVGPIISEVTYNYDNLNNSDVHGITKGDLTETWAFADSTKSVRVLRAGYDFWGTGHMTQAAGPPTPESPGGAFSYVVLDETYRQYVTSEVNALGHVEHCRHNSVTDCYDVVCGLPTVRKDLNGEVTRYTYDAFCRPARVDLPRGGYVRWQYENIGNPNAQKVVTYSPGVDGTGEIWSSTSFDGFGRVWEQTQRGPGVDPIVQKTTYDLRGNVYSQTVPAYANELARTHRFSYDALGRPTLVTNPDGTSQRREYTAWKVTSIDELSHVTSVDLDLYGRVIGRTEPNSHASYSYDLWGNLQTIVDAAGNRWTYTYYDALGLTWQLDDPDQGTRVYMHDDAGQLRTITDAKQQRVDLAYDALGRVRGRTTQASDGSIEHLVTWNYDEARSGSLCQNPSTGIRDRFCNQGQLTSMTDGLGQETYNYDESGNPVSATRTIDGRLYSLASGYDRMGRVLWTVYPDLDSIGSPNAPIVYDTAGRISAIPGYVQRAEYTAEGRPWRLVNANGTETLWGYSFNRGWLTQIHTTGPALPPLTSPTVIQHLTYAHDAEGKIKQVTANGCREGWSFTYDAMHRLTGALNHSDAAGNAVFEYDAVGNMTWNSRIGRYAYPQAGAPRPHAPTSVGPNAYTYDNNGNLVLGGGRSVTWKVDNLPASLNGATYAYDGHGRRAKTVAAGAVTVDIGAGYQETDGRVTKYVTLGGLLVGKKVGSTRYWIHTNHLGSVNTITDAGGAVVQTRSYEPYGDVLSQTGAHEEGRSFLGQVQEPAGIVHLSARDYDPELGRFLSPDPLLPGPRATVKLNRYAYAANDPVNRADVSGLDDAWVCAPGPYCSGGTGAGGGGGGGGNGGGVSFDITGDPISKLFLDWLDGGGSGGGSGGRIRGSSTSKAPRPTSGQPNWGPVGTGAPGGGAGSPGLPPFLAPYEGVDFRAWAGIPYRADVGVGEALFLLQRDKKAALAQLFNWANPVGIDIGGGYRFLPIASPVVVVGRGAAGGLANLLRPGGGALGVAGSRSSIRIVSGGPAEAERLFGQLSQGGRVVTPSGHLGVLVEMPGGGFVGYRPLSTSGPPTIDVNLPGFPDIFKIKFVQ